MFGYHRNGHGERSISSDEGHGGHGGRHGDHGHHGGHGRHHGRGGWHGRPERCASGGDFQEGPHGGPRGRGGFEDPRDGFGDRGEFGGRHGGPHGGPRGRRGGGGGRFFEHGALRLILLALVAEKPSHGYELIKAIEDLMGGAYTPSAGVVYPTLTLLEETGQIEVASAESNKKLYAATEAGRATLVGNKTQIDAIFARIKTTGEAREEARDPRVVRAIENFRLALRLKLDSGALDEAGRGALAVLLDETVARIEAL